MPISSTVDSPPERSAAPAGPPRRTGRLRQRLAGLFPDAPARPVGARRAVLALLAVAVGTAVSLGRTTGTGPFQSIWEEDARDILTDALMRPGAFNLAEPYVGYFQLAPRLMGEVAAFLPISWAAAALSVQAAVATALLTYAVYVACGAHFRHRLARFLVAAPMLFSPTAENVISEIYNRPVTVQFFLVYAVFWLLLWSPTGRAGRAVLVGVVGLAAFSTFLVVLFVPLALLRLYARRDRVSAALPALLAAGAAVQVAGLALGLTDRSFAVPRYEPLWALASYAVWAVPHSVLGWRLAASVTDVVRVENVGLIMAAWVVVAVVVVIALRRLTGPAWLLAAVAAAHSVGLACMTIMANGAVTQRYLLPVEMLLFTALAALLVPSARLRPAVAQAPLAALTVLVLVVSAANYRWDDTHRHHSPRWSEQVRRAATECQVPGRREVMVRSGPQPYFSWVTVPCHVIVKDVWCQDPYCVQVDAPPGAPPRRE